MRGIPLEDYTALQEEFNLPTVLEPIQRTLGYEIHFGIEEKEAFAFTRNYYEHRKTLEDKTQ